MPRSLLPTEKESLLLLMIKGNTKESRVLVMLPRQRRRWTTPRRTGPSLHKPRYLLRVVMPLGARPLVVTLQGITTPTIFFTLIIMGMRMLNMLVLMMLSLLILFGFQRPLLLTKEDPLRNGYLNPSNVLL